MTFDSKLAGLGVLFDPSLPLTENLAGHLTVSAGYGQDVESLVTADHSQTKTAINGLQFGEVDAAKFDWVLKADALRVDAQSWSPEQQPGNKTQQNQNGDNAHAQGCNDSVHCNCGKRKNPDYKSSELIRRRPEFFRRHWVILTDKVQVCA